MPNKLSEEDRTAVQDILIEQLSIARTQITPEARIAADLGADSLDVVEITMELEARFGRSIPDEEADQVQTVGDLYAAVAKLREPAEHVGVNLNQEMTHGLGRS